jgi:hypothetical protein
MKITNQTVAWLITLIILTILNYFIYLMCITPKPNDLIIILGGLGIALDLMFGIVFLINLWDDTIEFEITIPNPIGLMLKNYKSKLDKKITLNNLWVDLALEKDEKKVDLILKKIELLKSER